MANLEQLEQQVDELNEVTSNIFRFRDAYRGIERAAQDEDTDDDRLRHVLGTFRVKLPDNPIYNRMRADAEDLSDALMIAGLAERIARIRARNDTLADLTGALRTQIEKANKDASLLTRIKEAVDKATKTVEEVKALVDELQATDANTKSRLKALIETLGDISSIFKKQEA